MPYKSNTMNAQDAEIRQEVSVRDALRKTTAALAETQTALAVLSEFITGEKQVGEPYNSNPSGLMEAVMDNVDMATNNLCIIKAIMLKLGANECR